MCLTGCTTNTKKTTTSDNHKESKDVKREIKEYAMDELDGELGSPIAEIYSTYLKKIEYLTRDEIAQQKDDILTEICNSYKIPYGTKIRVRGKAYTDDDRFYLLYNEVRKGDVININTQIMAESYDIDYEEMIGEKNSFGLLCSFEDKYIYKIKNNENVLLEGIFRGYYLDKCRIISPKQKRRKYYDESAGVKFNIPGGWKEKKLSEKREFIKAKFVPKKENGLVLLYGSTDVWGQLPETEKLVYAREEIDNSFFSTGDIAEMYNLSSDKVETINIDGKEFFKNTIHKESDISGIKINYDMIYLTRVYNGWMYMFQFNGDENDEALLEMLRSFE